MTPVESGATGHDRPDVLSLVSRHHSAGTGLLPALWVRSAQGAGATDRTIDPSVATGYVIAVRTPAATHMRTDDGAEEIVTLEALNPSFDPEAETMTYGATIPSEYVGEGLAHAVD